MSYIIHSGNAGESAVEPYVPWYQEIGNTARYQMLQGHPKVTVTCGEREVCASACAWGHGTRTTA